MRRSTTLLALGLGLALPAAAPTQASAAEKSIWGPVDDVPGHGNAFNLYRRLGVDTFQIAINFANTSPTRPASPRDPRDPAYRWPASVDRAVAEGARTGIDVAIQVSRSPRWANGNKPSRWSPAPSAYADFLVAAARRYPSVRRWMIWGEPNRPAAYQPHTQDSTIGAHTYAKLLDAAYGALKRISGRNIVIGGMTYPGSGSGGQDGAAQWLRAMKLPNGRPPRLDWFGHNPFSARYPRLGLAARPGGDRDICDLDLYAKEIARTYRRIGRKPKLWLSEFVIQSDHGSRAFALYVSRRGQAQWLTAAFRIANSLPSVAGLGWLALQDAPESNLSNNYGLLTAKGARKPSFAAFRAAPSRAYRPAVAVARRVRRETLRKRGLRVAIRPRARGVINVVLTRRKGRARVARKFRASTAGARRLFTIRSRRLSRGRYTLIVDAPRGERVLRTVRVD